MRYETGPCPNAAVGGLPVCGPCLTVVLSERDPGRRRALAGTPGLPGPLLGRLATDPDDGVRARVATRDGLTDTYVANFTNPATEASPAVWRALAATPAGARHAAALAATGDRSTRLILATNAATPDDVLDDLARAGDAEITATVAATRSGQAPDAAVIAAVLDARNIAISPIGTPPKGTPWPGTPGATPGGTDGATVPGPGGPAAASDGPTTASARRRRVGVAVAAAIVIAGAVVAYLVTHDASKPSATTRPTATTLTAVTSPIVTGQAAPTTSEPASPGSTLPAADAPMVTAQVTMTAPDGKMFCRAVVLRITYDAPTAGVSITDDNDDELWQGPWRSGVRRRIELAGPTRTLHASIATHTDPATFQPSGAVSGKLC